MLCGSMPNQGFIQDFVKGGGGGGAKAMIVDFGGGGGGGRYNVRSFKRYSQQSNHWYTRIVDCSQLLAGHRKTAES